MELIGVFTAAWPRIQHPQGKRLHDKNTQRMIQHDFCTKDKHPIYQTGPTICRYIIQFAPRLRMADGLRKKAEYATWAKSIAASEAMHWFLKLVISFFKYMCKGYIWIQLLTIATTQRPDLASFGPLWFAEIYWILYALWFDICELFSSQLCTLRILRPGRIPPELFFKSQRSASSRKMFFLAGHEDVVRHSTPKAWKGDRGEAPPATWPERGWTPCWSTMIA
jgi:hypothetical protein